ncbi:hypothetical protein HDV06_005001 [Boothiomyces sp. JEL0866]|nr:hypothetical protein HDV06_005001 [Boothiomyces sp. JEL0866]
MQAGPSDCQRVALSWKAMNGLGGVDMSNSTSCCTFQGITCNGTSVTQISWSQKGLYGQIDPDLAFLESLTSLDLSHNSLYGVWNTNSSGADPTNFDSLKYCNVVGTTVCEKKICSMECINEVPKVCSVGECVNGMGSLNTVVMTTTATQGSLATFVPDVTTTAQLVGGNQNANASNAAISILPIFGATGGTGLQVIKQGLEKGYSFKILSRSVPPKGIPESDKITVIQGDALDQQAINETIKDTDSCIVSLGGSVCPTAQPLINKAVEEFNVKKMTVVTSLGCGESFDESNLVTKAIVMLFIRKPILEKNVQEEEIKKCKVDWTIVRPGGLTNGELTKEYKAQSSGLGGGSISRADVAHFILEKTLNNDSEYSKKAFTIVQ